MAGMRPQERLWIFPKVNRPVFLVSALLIVAFLPLLSDGLHDWLFQKIQTAA